MAEEFYTERCSTARGRRPAATSSRPRLRQRARKQFGVGFAPRGGEDLVSHLRAKGFTDEELVIGGLAGRGSRGLYDRFRGRLLWPIRDITGDTVGFGARRIFDDDRIEAKYLNTSETPLYKKSTVLYGLDLAKKRIAQEPPGRRRRGLHRRHGVPPGRHRDGRRDVRHGLRHRPHQDAAPASCATRPTSRRPGHLHLRRRRGRAEGGHAGLRRRREVVLAVVRRRGEVGQGPVRAAPGGRRPGGAALIEDAVPMFEFAVRTTIERFDLATAEGRVQAMRAVAPIVASIRDRSLRPEYTREVAGMLGVEVEQVAAEVSEPARIAVDEDAAEPDRPTARARPRDDAPEPHPGEAAARMQVPDRRDPVVLAERQLLQVLLQFPQAPPGARPAHARRVLRARPPPGPRRHPHRPARATVPLPGLDDRSHRRRAHCRLRARQRARRRLAADPDGPVTGPADLPLRRGAASTACAPSP